MSDHDLTATGGRFIAPEPCPHCGSSGHLAGDCLRRPLPIAQEIAAFLATAPDRCENCGTVYHDTEDCPKRMTGRPQ